MGGHYLKKLINKEVIMSKMFKYVSECSSLYGVVAVLFVCILLIILGVLVYKAIIFLIDKITKYKEIHTKANAGDISIEAQIRK